MIQLCVTIIYALVVATTLISHDVHFEERAVEYYLKDDQLSNDGSVILQKVLLVAELILLVLFIIDLTLHMVAYGRLFIKRLATFLEIFLILANIGILVTMLFEFKRSKDLFGVNILLTIPFLYLRVDTIKQKIESGQKSIA